MTAALGRVELAAPWFAAPSLAAPSFAVPSHVAPWFASACVALAALALLLWIAPRAGWIDDGSDAPERKHQRSAVPLVGGAALACAWCVDLLVFGPRALALPFAAHASIDTHAFVVAALLAFAVGFADDVAPRGLSVRAKVAGQLAAGIALAFGVREGAEPAALALQAACVLGAVAAQNALNTFDNADGAGLTVASLGFACAGAPLAAATLAVWPLNVVVRSRRDASVPRVYLGDSGAHFLGLVLFATPVAWAALVLPSLDLARVALERVRAGRPAWSGDRRHLAHRLERAGRGRLAVVVWLAVCAAPPIVAASCVRDETRVLPWLAAIGAGAALSSLAMAVALARSR